MVFGGIAGCLVFPLIDRLLPLRFLFLSIGLVGALFTLSLILLPRTPATFALALIGENEGVAGEVGVERLLTV